MEFNEMRDCFKKCFAQYDNEAFFQPNDAKWIYAVVEPQQSDLSGFHYELIARGSGAGEEYHVELHFELVRNQRPDLRKGLISKFAEPKLRRQVLATSYYSSLMWRVRRPVLEAKDIKEDLDILKDAVADVMGALRELPATVGSMKDIESEEGLILPCPVAIKKVAEMLHDGVAGHGDNKAKNRLVIPAVQRGKVWNAARIETLWDSIFKNFPIGALSVRCREDDSHAIDLLDGQQRATAVSLGFADFPGLDNKFDSILWIDLDSSNGNNDDYGFFVTTASQPWGYAESSSETRNSLLSANERREAAQKMTGDWEEGQVKPYPFQLYPMQAKVPVPYTLLREYAIDATASGNVDFSAFCERIRGKINEYLIRVLEQYNPDADKFRSLCDKVASIADDYKVLLLDASSVAENDIALYFTRIGKGGVVPSDEELAYSVLKSKLNADFRDVIQEVHLKHGLASEPRVAHLAIRLFKSGKDRFYSGSVFSAVMEMCKTENASDKQLFYDFIQNDFRAIVEKVEKNYQLTQWHSARYASERNGDVFLLLMLAVKENGLFDGYNIKGIAELLFGYATHIDYAVRKIFSEGVPIAIANLLKETHYGRARLVAPMKPDEMFKDVHGPFPDIKALLDWKNEHPHVAGMMAEGYHNSDNDRALNILLYACRTSTLNNQFAYNRELGLWSEENCPWDYDHIMPHSTIEKMADSDEKIACEWLKNSIGNLAPIPFWLNRSLSDSARDANYPGGAENQASLFINGADVEAMWRDGIISPLDFCNAVMTRYRKLYEEWYRDMGFGGIFDFKAAIESPTPSSELLRAAIRRYGIFKQVKSALPDMELSFKSIAAENKEQEIAQGSKLYEALCRDNVITLSVDVNGVSVALSSTGINGIWEIGLRKTSGASATNKDTYRRITAALERASHVDIDSDKLCEGETWWYWYDKYQNQEVVEVEIVRKLQSLHEFAKKIGNN